MKTRPSSPSHFHPLLPPLSPDSGRKVETQGQGLGREQELPSFRNALAPRLLGPVPMGPGAQMRLPAAACPWGGVSSDACPLGMWRTVLMVFMRSQSHQAWV